MYTYCITSPPQVRGRSEVTGLPPESRPGSPMPDSHTILIHSGGASGSRSHSGSGRRGDSGSGSGSGNDFLISKTIGSEYRRPLHVQHNSACDWVVKLIRSGMLCGRESSVNSFDYILTSTTSCSLRGAKKLASMMCIIHRPLRARTCASCKVLDRSRAPFADSLVGSWYATSRLF